MNDINEVISAAVSALSRGGTLLYPTDTIWGLGCDATDAAAVEKIYSVKLRDHSKSMLVLCSDLDMVEHFIAPASESVVRLLTETGRPTTVIMPLERSLLAPNLIASDGTIGVRLPQMDFCQQLLSRFGKPVVSTSANFSGHPSPSSYQEIDKRLVDLVDMKIPPEFEESSGGISSRIVKIASDGTVTVLRN